jgi:hypothetical protein
LFQIERKRYQTPADPVKEKELRYQRVAGSCPRWRRNTKVPNYSFPRKKGNKFQTAAVPGEETPR